MSTSPTTPPTLLTAPQVATLIGVSPRQVWNLAARGLLPRPIKLASSTRWRRAEVEAAIAALAPAAGKAVRK